jgi:plasmid segregation protein ParM
MIIGIDIGYSYTKDSKGNIFPTCYTLTEPIIKGKENKITLDNIEYWVGTGNINVELNKTNSTINKLSIINCLYLNKINSPVRIVTGLPINQYKNQKKQFKDIVMNMNGISYFVKGRKYNVNIVDTFIFPQCVSTLYTMNNKNLFHDIIIIDIGSRTVDIAYIVTENNNPRIIRYSTYYDGMYSLYSKLSKCINNRYNISLRSEDIENILQNGLYIKGVKQDINFLQDIMREHYGDIFNELSINYPTDISEMYMCGGGSHIIFNSFKKRYPHLQLIPNAQFSNANGYEIVGKTFWGE